MIRDATLAALVSSPPPVEQTARLMDLVRASQQFTESAVVDTGLVDLMRQAAELPRDLGCGHMLTPSGYCKVCKTGKK